MDSLHIVPPALERLIRSFASLPGIGTKTATRIALNILRRQPADALEMAQALAELHKSIQLCSCCLTFSENDPCVICSDHKRDSSLVCVVEQPSRPDGYRKD